MDPAQAQANGVKDARKAREDKAFELQQETVKKDLAALPKGTVKRVVNANTPKKGSRRKHKHRKTRRRR